MMKMTIRGAELLKGPSEIDTSYLHSPYPLVSKAVQGWQGWRGIETGNGMEGDLPGAYLEFKPRAERVEFLWIRNGVHSHPAMNDFFVATRGKNELMSIEAPIAGIRQFEISLSFDPSDYGQEFRLYFPYANSFCYLGLKSDKNALEGVLYQKPSLFYIPFGDSITHGYRATQVLKSYASRVSQKLDLPLYNMGFGSRTIVPTDPLNEFIPQPALISVLIGVNNALGGTTLEDYKKQVELYYHNLRNRFTGVPVAWLIPFIEKTFPGFDTEKKTGLEVIARVESYQEFLLQWIPALKDPLLEIVDTRSIQTKELLPDWIHPEDEGHEIFSEKIVDISKKLKPMPPSAGL